MNSNNNNNNALFNVLTGRPPGRKTNYDDSDRADNAEEPLLLSPTSDTNDSASVIASLFANVEAVRQFEEVFYRRKGFTSPFLRMLTILYLLSVIVRVVFALGFGIPSFCNYHILTIYDWLLMLFVLAVFTVVTGIAFFVTHYILDLSLPANRTIGGFLTLLGMDCVLQSILTGLCFNVYKNAAPDYSLDEVFTMTTPNSFILIVQWEVIMIVNVTLVTVVMMYVIHRIRFIFFKAGV